jgi:hypothetical protein
LENVIIHAELLSDDNDEQEKLCGGVLWALDALDVGSPSNRQRRYFSPTTDWDAIYRDLRMHMCQNFVADGGAKFCVFEVPCVVARNGTKAKILVYQRGPTSEKRLANIDEMDRLHDCNAGSRCGSYTLGVTDDDRNGLNGRAFSSDAVWAITRTWKEVDNLVTIVPMDVEDYGTWPSSEQMRVYTAMYKQSPHTLSGYLTALAVDLTMPLLDLAAIMSAQYTTPVQTKAPGYVKPSLGPSADYCIDCQINDGTHNEVEFNTDVWVLMLFFQKERANDASPKFDQWCIHRLQVERRGIQTEFQFAQDRRVAANKSCDKLSIYWAKHPLKKAAAAVGSERVRLSFFWCILMTLTAWPSGGAQS